MRNARPAYLHLGSRVIAVVLAYYVGARIGFLFTTPLVLQSVLWLPNSILLAVLIVSPPRVWPLYLVPSFAPQLLVGYQAGAPLPTISLLFITNCLDAMLGATIWRIASRGATSIRSLRSMVVFIVFGATLPTLLVSFADSAISVATHASANFWVAYMTRARSNVLTNVIFVPPALAVLGGEYAELVWQWRSRWVEATLMLLGLVATSLVAARAPHGTIGAPALSYLPLTIIFWCAVRFDVGMTGAAMLALTYLMTWTSIRDMDVATHTRIMSVAALQYALLALAVPILCLAAVVQDRERASRALASSQRALRRSVADIQALSADLVGATERERSRIAIELHDDIGQKLVALSLGLVSLKRRLPDDPQLRAMVVALQDQTLHAAEDVRLLSHDLHPAALRFGQLVPALQELCAQFERGGSIRTVFAARPEEVSVADDVALCVYRVTQEALTNVLHHSGAREVRVTLHARGRSLDLHIEDDGVGFDGTARRTRGGLGLPNMEERVRLVGGTIRFEWGGRGAHIFLRIPNRGAHDKSEAEAAARG